MGGAQNPRSQARADKTLVRGARQFCLSKTAFRTDQQVNALGCAGQGQQVDPAGWVGDQFQVPCCACQPCSSPQLNIQHILLVVVVGISAFESGVLAAVLPPG